MSGGVEEACEIEMTGTKMAAMILADMYVAEFVPTGEDGCEEICFLDIHVIAGVWCKVCDSAPKAR
jgi:hypothetical protein